MSASAQALIKKDGVWTVNGRPRETVKLLSHKQPSCMPGKAYLTLLLTLPANGATPSHFHFPSAIMGLMIHGAMINQFNDEKEPTVYRAGEVWYEGPGCHHVRSENVGEKGRDEEEASAYVVVVVDTEILEKDGLEGLVRLDADNDEKSK
ncbi:hypothetical protein MMC22_008256 [Lobaria immixta]|nr:hypothetical protein [Lobaria immixta]